MDAPKLNRRYSCLGVGLLTVIIVCIANTLVWPAVQAVAVADGQRSRRSELAQARARWEVRPSPGASLTSHRRTSYAATCQYAVEYAVLGMTSLTQRATLFL